MTIPFCEEGAAGKKRGTCDAKAVCQSAGVYYCAEHAAFLSTDVSALPPTCDHVRERDGEWHLAMLSGTDHKKWETTTLCGKRISFVAFAWPRAPRRADDSPAKICAGCAAMSKTS